MVRIFSEMILRQTGHRLKWDEHSMQQQWCPQGTRVQFTFLSKQTCVQNTHQARVSATIGVGHESGVREKRNKGSTVLPFDIVYLLIVYECCYSRDRSRV